MSSAEPRCPVNGLAMMSYHRSMVSDIVPPGSNLEKYLGPSVISMRITLYKQNQARNGRIIPKNGSQGRATRGRGFRRFLPS